MNAPRPNGNPELPLSRLSGVRQPKGAPCATHPDQPAWAVCERCGDFTCARCLWAVEGRHYCGACFEILRGRGSLESARQTFLLLPRMALCWAGFSLCWWWLPGVALLPATIAVWQGVRALRLVRQRPDLPGRGLAIAAIALASISAIIAAITLFLQA
ncbi:MAG TPA: hypothetical protein VK689_18440 [Armatimonadota bacterium]|nr:hypothetical protein [Armatimonadota bacterium]